MRSREASLRVSRSLSLPADSCEAVACSISLCVEVAGAAAGAETDGGAGAAALGCKAVAGGAWRAQAHSASSAASVSQRIILGLLPDSAHALHVGGDVAHLFRGQAFGDGEHHDAVAAGRHRLRPAVARAVRIVGQLLHDVDRLLGAKCRIAGGEIAAPYRAVAGDAG